METVFIVFYSFNNRGNTATREVKGVFHTLALAQQKIIDEVSLALQYESDFPQNHDGTLVLDEKESSHNGGVLKATREDFTYVTFWDGDKTFSENTVTYEIEEHIIQGVPEKHLSEVDDWLSWQRAVDGVEEDLKEVFLLRFAELLARHGGAIDFEKKGNIPRIALTCSNDEGEAIYETVRLLKVWTDEKGDALCRYHVERYNEQQESYLRDESVEDAMCFLRVCLATEVDIEKVEKDMPF